MRIGITRREVAAALGGISAAGWIGLPAFGAVAGTMSLPPPCRSGGIEAYLVDEAHELYSVACAEWRACSRLEQTGQGGLTWSRLYVMKVDAAAAIRDRLGYLSADERSLRGWLAGIYQTRLSAVARSEDLAHVGPSLKAAGFAFQEHVLRLPFPKAAIRNGISPIPPDAATLEAVVNGGRDAAWSVLAIAPQTASDAALHRRAAMFAVDSNVVRFLQAGWAGIEAARSQRFSSDLRGSATPSSVGS